MFSGKKWVLKSSRDNVSKIHLDDEEWNAQNKIFGMNALWSGEKVSCPPSTVLHVEVCNKTRRTYDLKLNALLIL